MVPPPPTFYKLTPLLIGFLLTSSAPGPMSPWKKLKYRCSLPPHRPLPAQDATDFLRETSTRNKSRQKKYYCV